MFLSICDFAEHYQVLFQDSATAEMFFITACHSNIMFYLFIILFVVVIITFHIFFFSNATFFSDFFLVFVLYFSNRFQKWNEDEKVEIFWTELPTLLVIFLVVPVLIYMFSFQEIDNKEWGIVIHVIGQQWFWGYEYVFFNNWGIQPSVYEQAALESGNMSIDLSLVVESRMVPEDELGRTGLRLLEVDNILSVPVGVPIHLLVTGNDVIHSWSVPSLGVKVDAVPGRINHVCFTITRPGRFFGQCSELCGVNHGFMPIVVQSFYFF
jgi:cytochrome c oxidase subunit 2